MGMARQSCSWHQTSLQIEKSGPAPVGRIQAAWLALPQQFIRNTIDAQRERVELVVNL